MLAFLQTLEALFYNKKQDKILIDGLQYHPVPHVEQARVLNQVQHDVILMTLNC